MKRSYYRINRNFYRINPPLKEATYKRLDPVLEEIAGIMDGPGCILNILSPSNIDGFIDFFYDDENKYCAIFDLRSKSGKELHKTFSIISKDDKLYEFKPTSDFRVKGKLIAKKRTNDFEWFILQRNY